MIGGLSGSVYQTFILILKYLASRESKTYCFKYRGLQNWFFYKYKSDDKPEYHTVERAIRHLARLGVLRRIEKRGGREVIFCPGRYFDNVKWDYIRVLENAGSLDEEHKKLLEYLKNTPTPR